MKYFAALISILSLLLFSGCSNDGAKVEELFETAQFEELQKNQENARELYEDIMQKYPDTTFAQKAKIRLAKLKK